MPVFRKGEVILFSRPYAFALYESFVDSTCSFCFRTQGDGHDFAPIECHSCKVYKYCSDECLRLDQMDHWLECQVAKRKLREFPSIEARMIYRACLRYMREKQTQQESAEYIFGHKRSIHAYLDHVDKISTERREAFYEIVDDALDLVSSIYAPDRELMFLMLNRIAINSHDVICPKNWSMGRAIYMAGSKVNHSCEIHDRFVQQFFGRNYAIMALKTVEINSVDDLSVPYLPLMMDVHARQKHLKDNYYFDCKCSRCLYELEHPTENLCPPDYIPQLVDALEEDEQEIEFNADYFTLCKNHLGNLSSVADYDYYKHRLLYNAMYVSFALNRCPEGIYFGLRALRAALSPMDCEHILVGLFNGMMSAGWSKPLHPKFADFVSVLRIGSDYFTTVRGPGNSIARDMLKQWFKVQYHIDALKGEKIEVSMPAALKRVGAA
ncbi:histone-lysine N-methyltransferase SMYD3-like [Galendromus occidentalis]|uniref:Histone-lysine N-methyltransferase SMYD3-like n=1 Tax=Galendromus occidentalis TaxID=34638 RepID=A0AAJ6QT39_9ACAR|nr:histone-lysine N-methyltransferase SMYD3-like [Galendromus occidentalis]